MKEHDGDDDDTRQGPAWTPLDRRTFLKAAGCGVFVLIPVRGVGSAEQAGGGQRSYPDDFNAYLKIGEDGRVTCYSGKVEMGQANTTALAQMLAEELEVPFDRVDMVMGDTGLCPWDGGTNGSRSIKYFGPALRAAGAEAREVLVQLAADRLTLPAARLAARDGFVVDRTAPGTRVAYGTLVKGTHVEAAVQRAEAVRLPRLSAGATKPALKTPPAFTVMGRSLARTDARDKVTGKAAFAGDIRLPGMLHGRVLRPPVHGARLKSVDLDRRQEVQGCARLPGRRVRRGRAPDLRRGRGGARGHQGGILGADTPR